MGTSMRGIGMNGKINEPLFINIWKGDTSRAEICSS